VSDPAAPVITITYPDGRSEQRPLPSHDADHLMVWHKSVDFLKDERFMAAYRRGWNSGHFIGRPGGMDHDLHIEWRIHTCCWAAAHAAGLEGDFAECGTNTGIMSLAVCQWVDFNGLDKDFWLFDTFDGIPADQMTAEERALGREAENEHWYRECFETAKANFAPYPRARLIRGRVPETLSQAPVKKLSYLCLDMNIAAPELAAITHFWPLLVPGAVVVLDDYGWTPHVAQKRALDQFATAQNAQILLLPTGQGLLMKR